MIWTKRNLFMTIGIIAQTHPTLISTGCKIIPFFSFSTLYGNALERNQALGLQPRQAINGV